MSRGSPGAAAGGATVPDLLLTEPRSPASDDGGGLHRVVRREVLGRILTGKSAPGDRMSVSGLAEETGISRTPVREALLQLQREGFLTLEENRGFFVRELTEREARELYPILHALEDLALVSGGRPSRAHLERLEAMNARLAESAEPEEAIAFNVAWHRLLTEPCVNEELLLLLDRYRMRVYRYERAYYEMGAERVEYSVALHARILDALRAGDLAGARAVLEHHWVGDYSLYLPRPDAPSATRAGRGAAAGGGEPEREEE